MILRFLISKYSFSRIIDFLVSMLAPCRTGEDTELARHMDQSAVTFNVCLGGVFKNAEVSFEHQRDDPSLLLSPTQEADVDIYGGESSRTGGSQRGHKKVSVTHKPGTKVLCLYAHTWCMIAE